MKFFINLSTRVKLLLGFGFILILFFIAFLTAINGLMDITQSEKRLSNAYFQAAFQLSEMKAHQNFNRALILDMMLTTNKAEQQSMKKLIQEKTKSIDEIISNLSTLDLKPQLKIHFNELKNEIYQYRQIRNEEIALIENIKIKEAQLIGVTSAKNSFDKVHDLVAKLVDEANKEVDAQLIIDQNQADSAILLFIVFGVISIIFCAVMVYLLNKTIAQPLNTLTMLSQKIGEGDLNLELPSISRKDEVGILLQTYKRMISDLKKMASTAQQIASGNLTGTIIPQSDRDILGNAFLQMINNLRQITKDIHEGINLLGSSASEILAATTQVASGAAETATAISETTTTVEEVRQAAQLSSQKASRVSENAQNVSQVTQTGQKSVEDTINGMLNIQKQMESVANTIIRLSEQSQQIGGIIASVNDIADQSNLLAVNAAIEAAKAGDQGRGFAVVAQEIKNLAQQSKDATIQVRNILNDIQKVTSTAVMAAEQTSKAIDSGVKQSTQAGESIKKLAESSSKAVEAATQIVASSQQQVVGMDQIGLAMNNINQAGAENAASMLQAEKAAKNLNELGQKLKQLVEQFKL